jgi:LmbE family N-acetylglucosaminyl deacetylase
VTGSASILAVTAHPDDESFSFGGALAVHAMNGSRCAVLCLTDGQAGRTGGLVERERLGEVRRRELEAAAQILGIPELFTPGLMDGALRELADEDGAAVVREFADRFGADVLVTFGPEGASGHEDHKACWRWTVRAAGDRRVYALSWPPDPKYPPRGGPPLPITTVVDVSALGDRKRRAFLAHRTQQDHLERHEQIMAALGGKEYYHRAQPPWRAGGPLETSLAP